MSDEVTVQAVLNIACILTQAVFTSLGLFALFSSGKNVTKENPDIIENNFFLRTLNNTELVFYVIHYQRTCNFPISALSSKRTNSCNQKDI